MMRKIVTFVLLLICLSVTSVAQMGGGMTDKQVVEYVQNGLLQGKSQQQISTELARRGVTKEQAERVKLLYEQQKKNGKNSSSSTLDNTKGRSRTKNGVKEKEDGKDGSDYIDKNFNFDDSSEKKEVPVYKYVTTEPLEPKEMGTYTIDRDGNIVYDNNTILYLQEEEEKKEEKVFGRDIFNTKNLTFEPSVNLATPVDYHLGPGDEVIIDIWGTNQATIRDNISPDGYINIEDIGLVYLNGMTVSEATDYLRKELNRIYAGIDSEKPVSQIKVTLGDSRTIQVNVMGEVLTPGTYALSSFSSVFHALYRAGGVNDIGSLRAIQLVRGGKPIATIDVYDFIMRGKATDDIRLQEGDVVIVPPYQALVTIEGNVKRPMKYEMKDGENVKTLLKYAGGFSGDAYTRALRMIRQNGREYQVYTIDDIDYSVFPVKDGDKVTAEAILNRFENKLEIKGAVYRPGIYQFGGSLNTVRQLVKKADGLMGDAFTARAVLHRERDNLTREVISVDIKKVLDGTIPDIPLQKNDVLYIPSIHDLQDMGVITVFGEVARPGELPYADNTTLEDIIIQAGGLKESASTVRVDVSRRIKDNKSTDVSSTIGKMYSFSLKDGFVIDGEPGFVLQPYDQVYVRRSPGYQEQANVDITGEVLYDGTYALTNKSERLSDLVKKAGGVTPFAYVKGAKLIRQANDEELKSMEDVFKMMRREMGQANMDSLKLDLDSVYSVGIDLELAMKNPGSSADVVLRAGDKLVVPELSNTVKINGAVMLPNTVAYKDNKSVKYYISQAGGFANNARKSRAFIIYMNGQVAKVKGSGRNMIEPGCEIVVPIKDKNGRMNFQTILGIASSIGSLGLTAASIANILK